MNQLFERQKKFSEIAKKTSIRDRIQALKKLEQVVEAEQNRIEEALRLDYKKSQYEAYLTEISPVILEIRHCIKHLYSWSRPHRVARTPLLWSASSEIHYEAKGVCLIIAPWNYPFNLAIAPLIPAIAAGNTVILKPSELTPHTSRCIAQIVEQVFEPQWVSVVQGGVLETQKLLELPFDHIFFTGSPQVGKIVLSAAAKNLTPVTLELGGKSPTVVTESASVSLAAQKIAWGKFLNAGQTCVAPDYVLVHASRYTEYVESVERHLSDFFVAGRKNSSDYCHIISKRHKERLQSLIGSAQSSGATIKEIVPPMRPSGSNEDGDTFLNPTLVLRPGWDTELMQEEIFGPILPILSYTHLEEALAIIKERPKPLAIYVFSKCQKQIKQILSETSSGGVCINDVMIHFSHSDLPFGGVGQSGMGNYHGEFGFRTFSNSKAVVRQGAGGRWMALVYPPYFGFKYKLLKLFMRFI